MKFRAKAIESGLVGWDGKLLYLPNSELSKASGSLAGKPVLLEHNCNKTIGVVKNARMDGNWLICEGEADMEGYEYVSVGYKATIRNEKGEFNNIEYDVSAKDIIMDEISFVDDPRYSEARLEKIKNSVNVDNGEIFVHNVYKIEKEDSNMFKIFNNRKEAVEGVKPDSVLILNNGEETTVAEVVEKAEKADLLEKENTELKDKVAEVEAKVAEVEEKLSEEVENSKKFVTSRKEYTKEEVLAILNEVDQTDKELEEQIKNSNGLTSEDEEKLKKLNKIVKGVENNG